MDKRVKKSLWLLLAVIVTYTIVIILTMPLSASWKGIIHLVTAIIFLAILFNIWSSFKNANTRQVLYTILVIAGFIVALPIGIELVGFLPIFLKGIAHFLLVALFAILFIMVWKDDSKAS